MILLPSFNRYEQPPASSHGTFTSTELIYAGADNRRGALFRVVAGANWICSLARDGDRHRA